MDDDDTWLKNYRPGRSKFIELDNLVHNIEERAKIMDPIELSRCVRSIQQLPLGGESSGSADSYEKESPGSEPVKLGHGVAVLEESVEDGVSDLVPEPAKVDHGVAVLEESIEAGVPDLIVHV